MTVSWLITGGCGFIGQNLLDNLLTDKTNYIRIVDNLSVGRKENLAELCEFTDIDGSDLDKGYEGTPGTVDFVKGDITDTRLMAKVTCNINNIVHLAANTGVIPSIENPMKDMEDNVKGIVSTLEGARLNKVQTVIFASSGAPVGAADPPIHEDLVPRPMSPYGASKLAGEAYCSAYYHCFNINTIALRFSNVYGPKSAAKQSAVALFIKKILNNETIHIFGDGEQTRDFIYVDDLVGAIKNASQRSLGGNVFQIATSKPTSINDLMMEMKKAFEKKDIKNIKVEYKDSRKGEVLNSFCDISKAKSLLEWSYSVNLQEGLGRTIDWFLKNKVT